MGDAADAAAGSGQGGVSGFPGSAFTVFKKIGDCLSAIRRKYPVIQRFLTKCREKSRMKKIRDSSEAEMILSFLKGEIASPRFHEKLCGILKQMGLESSITRRMQRKPG